MSDTTDASAQKAVERALFGVPTTDTTMPGIAAPGRGKNPRRVQLLQEGVQLTHGTRDAEYGAPALNLACAGELKRVIRRHATRDMSDAEQEALDMVITKLSRLVTGKPKADTYVDLATYAAIAGEVAGV